MITGNINIKVIVKDGIVQDVLCDDIRIPILVEIVDIDKDYEDYRRFHTNKGVKEYESIGRCRHAK